MAAMHPIPYAMRLTGRMRPVSDGVLRRVETELPDGARLESELLFADEVTFREQGTLSFSSGNDVRFRTLGTGQLTASPDPALRHGTVTWELDGGSGRFDQAAGRITSNFTVAADGAVEDAHAGLVFLFPAPLTKGERP
jgi:hypothetical protein